MYIYIYIHICRYMCRARVPSQGSPPLSRRPPPFHSHALHIFTVQQLLTVSSWWQNSRNPDPTIPCQPLERCSPPAPPRLSVAPHPV